MPNPKKLKIEFDIEEYNWIKNEELQPFKKYSLTADQEKKLEEKDSEYEKNQHSIPWLIKNAYFVLDGDQKEEFKKDFPKYHALFAFEAEDTQQGKYTSFWKNLYENRNVKSLDDIVNTILRRSQKLTKHQTEFLVEHALMTNDFCSIRSDNIIPDNDLKRATGQELRRELSDLISEFHKGNSSVIKKSSQFVQIQNFPHFFAEPDAIRIENRTPKKPVKKTGSELIKDAKRLIHQLEVLPNDNATKEEAKKVIFKLRESIKIFSEELEELIGDTSSLN